MKKFKYQETNKYSKLRNDLIEFGFDGFQTRDVIKNIYEGESDFRIGRLIFVSNDIFRDSDEILTGDYIGAICDGYHVFSK